MAQTVALDHYAESVERMIVQFMNMNMKIEETGNFDLLDKKDLYKLVASNNTVITNVLSKVSTHDSCFFSLYFFDWVCCILFYYSSCFQF